jgi:hypothetical protein
MQEFEHHSVVGKVVEQRDDMTPARMGGVGITEFEQDLELELYRYNRDRDPTRARAPCRPSRPVAVSARPSPHH